MRPKITRRFPHKKELLLKHQEQQQKFRRLQEDALQETQRLADILVHKFGVKTVYLTGPLSYDQYQEGMPLELALEGIPDGMYAKALAELSQASSFDIALIDLAQTDDWTKRSLRETGRVLVSK